MELNQGGTYVDIQWLVTVLLGLVAFFGVMFVRDLKVRGDNHADRLRHIELNYLTKEEFKETSRALFNKLDKIEIGITECRIQGILIRGGSTTHLVTTTTNPSPNNLETNNDSQKER